MSVDLLKKALEKKSGTLDVEKKSASFTPIESALTSAGNTYTFGAAPYLAAALPIVQSYLSKATGIGGPQQSYLPGGEKKEYLQNLNANRQINEQAMMQNPLSSLAGSFGSMFLPGNLAGKFLTGTQNLAMRGAPALQQGIGVLPNLGRAANVIGRNIAGGALGGIGLSQAMSTKPLSDVQGRTNEALLQGGIGGLLGGAVGAISPAAQATKIGLSTPRGQALLDAVKSVPLLGKVGNIINAPKTVALEQKYSADLIDADKKYLAQKAAIEAEKRLAKEMQQIDFAKQQQAIKEAKDAALNSVKTFQKADNKTIGQQFSNWFNNKAAKFKNEFEELKGGVLSNFGKSKANVTTLDKSVDDVLLKDFGYKAGETKIEDITAKILDPERKKAFETVVKLKNSLGKNNLTLKEVDALRQDFQSLAEFAKANRSSQNVLYQNISQNIDDVFKENLMQQGGKNAVSAYEKANEIYTKNIDAYNTLKDISSTAPENIIKTARSKFTGSFIDTVRSQQPELVNPVKDIILNDIAQNVKNPKQLTKALDTYGRDSLSGLFGPEMWGKILKTEEVLAKEFARTAVKQQIPNSILLAAAKKGIVQKPVLPNAYDAILDSAISGSKILTGKQSMNIINNFLRYSETQNNRF